MVIPNSVKSRTTSAIKQVWQKPRLRFKALAGGLFIVLVLIVPLILSQAAQAYVLVEQDDWSGGQGPDGTSQYDSADNITVDGSGHLTLGTANVTDWCNTANCDTAWTNRKPITISNSGSSTIDHEVQVQLTVLYDVAMKADFADLRFTNVDGTTDLEHYLQSKSDGVTAQLLVEVPADTLPVGDTTIHMYFGNGAASSTSTVAASLATGQFDADGPLDPRWQIIEGEPQIINGEVPIPNNGQTMDFLLDLGTAAHLTATRVVETTVQITGTTPNPASNYIGSIVFSSNTSVDFGTNSNSWNGNDGYENLSINTVYRDGEYISTYGPDGPKFVFNYNDILHFKTTFFSGASENSEILMSVNGGQYVTVAAKGGSGAATYPKPQFKNAYFNSGAELYDNYIVKDLTMYTLSEDVTTSVGQLEYQGGKTGSLTSAVYDLGAPAAFGKLNFTTNNVGMAGVRLRTSNASDMSGATAFGACPLLINDTQLPGSGCVTTGHRYAQYQVLLTEPAAQPVVFEVVQFEYVTDTQPPDTNATNLETRVERPYSPGYKLVPENGWANEVPSFTWQAAEDNIGGSGIKGYCLYFGADENADPATDSGLLTSGDSPLDTNGACPFAVGATSFDPNISFGQEQDGTNGYFKIKAIDELDNIYSGTPTSASMRFDSTDPQMSTVFNGPQGVINNTIFNVTWAGPSSGGQFFDETSGVAGLKYCITSAQAGFAGCGLGSDSPDNFIHWYGATHNGDGLYDDLTDVYNVNDELFTTASADAAHLDENGLNVVNFIILDNAGNMGFTEEGFVIVNMSEIAPSAPTNLQVTPTSSNQNNFSFTWQPPDQLSGPVEAVDYCWTVNVNPASDGSDCNWTGQGITQLAAGPFATQQGTNTLYLVAKDQATNFDAANVASVTFSASTVAPGVPQDAEISDVSIRATSTWRLALSWAPPQQGADIISTYRVLRSTDNINFSVVGSTSKSNTSFIDSGLSQVDYYYKIVACDNAGSCGVASNVVAKKPTGRFTEPAKLTADSDQPEAKNITTRKATIQWYTDRDSDSKVALGTTSGNYFSEEIGSSAQVSGHSVSLSNLLPNTRYYYVAKWTDVDGNTGQSNERSFTTAPAPEVSEAAVKDISISSARVNFSSIHASKVKLYYGLSENFGGQQEINSSPQKSSYSLPLEGLNDGSKYFFKLNTVDSDGNEYQGDIYSFTTLARPVITNLSFQPVEGAGGNSQKISWNTNVPTTSELTYSASGGRAQEMLISTLVAAHELTITGLNDDTEYLLVVRSRDVAGNLAQSSPQTFKTALDTRPPTVSDIKLETSVRQRGDTPKGQIIASWKTDEPSTSQITYGLGQTGPYTNTTAEDSRLTTEHVVVISDLSPSSIYHLKAVSADKTGNKGESDRRSVIIGRGSENVFAVIFRTLQQIFGIEGSLSPALKWRNHEQG